MNTRNFRYRKCLIVAALLTALYGSMIHAATITQTAVDEVTLSSTIQIDSAATDFYIFGENVKKKDGPVVFSDVSGPLSTPTDSEVKIAWTGGDPTLSATGSTKYDVCLSGKSFKSPAPVSCQFTVKMPSRAATLEFWLIPNGNTKPISYDVTVGGAKNSYSNQPSKRHYRRFAYSITNAKVNESITVTVNNITGDNDWHNIGFQAAQLKAVKATQTITFTLDSLSGKTFGDKPFYLTATASSKLPVSYAATGSCTVSNQTVTLTGAGTCTITASQAGNNQFNAAPSVTQSFTIAKATQTLKFEPITRGTVGKTADLTATASSGLTAITFTSTTQEVCTVTGSQVAFKGVGTCQITAKQAGNNNYFSAEAKMEIIVLAPPKITPLDSKTVGDAEFPLNATSTAGLPVELTLDLQSKGICELNGGKVKPVGVGTCIINGFQAGNATTNPTQAEFRFDIVKGTQVITFTPPASANVGEKMMLTAIGGGSENPVTFASSPTNICTVNENTVSFLATGTCTITANQAGNVNYNAATEVSAKITVSNAPKTDQTISFSPALKGTVGTNATLSATASSGLTEITFASSPATVCTINGNVVSFVGAGDCVVTAMQTGNTQYNWGEKNATIQVIKKEQQLNFVTSSIATVGETGILAATVDSGLTDIQFTSESNDICQITNNNNIAYKSQGTCKITVKQLGNNEFNAIEKTSAIEVVSNGTFSLTIANSSGYQVFQAVEGENLKIGLTVKANTSDVGKAATFYLKATVGNLSLMLTKSGFLDATDPLQPVATTTLPEESFSLPLYEGMLPAGTYAIYTKYKTSDSREEVTSVFIIKKKQELTFGNISEGYVGSSATLEITGGGSNNPIQLNSTTTDICTIKDKTVSFVAEGSCMLTATQAGNESFTEAGATTTIAVKSLGAFSLEITDMKNLPIKQVTDKDTFNVGITFVPPTNDIGKAASFYLTATAGTNKLMFANGQWVTATNPLQAANTIPAISKEMGTFPLYSGKLPVGSYTVYATYQTANSNSKQEITSIINVISYQYLISYMNAKDAGKSEKYAVAYATAISNGKSERYASTYAALKEGGKSELYATKYAEAFERLYNSAVAAKVSLKDATQVMTRLADIYAIEYVKAKESGKSDVYAEAYANTKSNIFSPNEVYAVSYATARDAGKSDDYASVYAYSKTNGRSDSYADSRAKIYEQAKSNGDPNALGFSEFYADKLTEGKTDLYAKAYASKRSTGKSNEYSLVYAESYNMEYGFLVNFFGFSHEEALPIAGYYAEKITEGKSNKYALTYASKRINGASEVYADAYASAIESGKSEEQATLFASTKESGKSDAYAKAYLKAKTTGKSDDYAKNYATAIDSGKPHSYATSYAFKKAEGKSDQYANMYALKGDAGKSDTYSDNYATTIESGKSDVYATIYADQLASKRSKTYAVVYATKKEQGKSDVEADFYASQKDQNKTDGDAEKMTSLFMEGYADRHDIYYASAYAEQRMANKSVDYAKVFVAIKADRMASNAYATAYTDTYFAKSSQGKSSTYADHYATVIAEGKSATYAQYYADRMEKTEYNFGGNSFYVPLFADVYASLKVQGKSEDYISTYINAAYSAFRSHHGDYRTYAAVYADLIQEGKSADYAHIYARLYAYAKMKGKSNAFAAVYASRAQKQAILSPTHNWKDWDMIAIYDNVWQYTEGYFDFKNQGKSDDYADRAGQCREEGYQISYEYINVCLEQVNAGKSIKYSMKVAITYMSYLYNGYGQRESREQLKDNAKKEADKCNC